MIGRSLAFLVTCSSLASVACSGSAPPEEDTGRASAAITEVPADVGCIEIDVTGARSVVRRYDVTSGQSSSLSITGLPLGLDTFVGLAYPGVCAAVTSATQATWISDATQASLVAQQVASIAIDLHPNGQGTVGVNFTGDDGGTDAASPTCPVPLTSCAGVCTTTQSDPANCGGCGIACSGPNATARCTMASCQIAACNAGFADCDQAFSNGCETDVTSSPSNCGGCGVACNTLNGTPACTMGICTIATCNGGFADCDGNSADGCETSLLNSTTSCGACGNVCPAGQTCKHGLCG